MAFGSRGGVASALGRQTCGELRLRGGPIRLTPLLLWPSQGSEGGHLVGGGDTVLCVRIGNSVMSTSKMLRRKAATGK